MASPYNITWFKAIIAPRLHGFTLHYRYFESGDLGSLHQAEFNSAQQGGSFDFWGMDWLGIHLVDYGAGDERFNQLLSAAQEPEKQLAIDAFLALL